jgi:hypothetical protein
MMSAHKVPAALGGQVVDRHTVLAPGPGHSKNDRHLHAITIEYDRLGRNGNTGRLARDAKFDRAIDSRRESTIRVRDVYFGQQCARASLQRVSNPCDLATELAIGNFRHTHDRVDARCRRSSATGVPGG